MFGPAFAALYDSMAARFDRRGGAGHRPRLVADAPGEVVERRAGTGANRSATGPPPGSWCPRPTPQRCGGRPSEPPP